MNGQYSTDSPWIVDTDGKKITAIVNPDGTQSSLAYVGTNLPNLRAEETLYPYRVVMAGVNAFGVLGATMDGDTLLGVTDGSTRAPGASQHALNGEPVRLQQSDFVQVTAGGNVVVSDLLIPTNEGKVIAYTGSSATCLLQAIQAGTDGSVIWCKKIGAFGIGGGVSPITGGGWPDTSKSLWQSDFVSTIPLFPNTGTNNRAGVGPEFYWGEPAGQAANYVSLEADWYPEEYANGIVNFSVMGPNYKGYVGEYAPNGWFGNQQCPAVTAQWQNHELVAIFKTGFSLSNYILCVGATNSQAGDAYDHTLGSGFFFRYQPGNNGGRWMCHYNTIDSDTYTMVSHWVDSGITVQPYTSYNLKIVTTEGAGALVVPTVQFYINGALVASPDLTALPVVEQIYWPTMSHTILLKNQSTMGAFSSSHVYIDYMHHLVTFPQGRTSWATGSSES